MRFKSAILKKIIDIEQRKPINAFFIVTEFIFEMVSISYPKSLSIKGIKLEAKKKVQNY